MSFSLHKYRNSLLLLSVIAMINYLAHYQMSSAGGTQTKVPKRSHQKSVEIVYFHRLWSRCKQPRWISDDSCPGVEPGSCILHSDHNRISVANAVVFTAGMEANVKNISKTSKQIFILATKEAPARLHFNYRYPDHFFNATMTFSSKADIPFTYQRVWLTREQADEKELNFEPLPPVQPRNRSYLIAAAISNCHTTPSGRTALIRRLEDDGYLWMMGKCARKQKVSVPCSPLVTDPCIFNEYNCTKPFFENAYFFLALENTICQDYVTEKYWRRAHAESVPILWSRDAAQNQNIPPNSVIFIEDFGNYTQFVQYLQHLAAMPEEYAKYFEHRSHMMIIDAPSRECQLCKAVQNWKSKSYKNAYRSFKRDCACIGNVANKFLQI